MSSEQPKSLQVPFGLWPSSFTAANAAAGGRRLGTLQADDGWLVWSESRPEERGRQTLLRCRIGSGPPEELIGAPYSARSRVHEYGGGELLAADGLVYFVNDTDQDIYSLVPGSAPRPVTAEPDLRFADLVLDDRRSRLIAVCERHLAGQAHPENLLVSVALSGAERGKVRTLLSGRDFYAAPRLSPDGSRLAFLAWDLPHMPWDAAELATVALDSDGQAGIPRHIAGGPGEAAFQPEWDRQGRLLFVWEAGAYGNLYRHDEQTCEALFPEWPADLMRAHWVFGMRSYAISEDGGVLAAFIEQGRPRLRRLGADATEQPVAPQPTRAARIDDPVAVGQGFAAVIGNHDRGPSIAYLKSSEPAQIVHAPSDPAVPASMLSMAEVRSFPRPDGSDAFGLFYAPRNDSFHGPPGVLPPAIVLAHGGPTSMAGRGFAARIQFYTSRGFAVMDVDYAGSTGYGRAYRERLDGNWGIADVADCVAAARHLGDSGLADPSRIAIAGGSAGGYTVLMALATTRAFAAGSSHYGICDLSLLLQHTHKFEAGYLHRLLGTRPQAWTAAFRERSPLALIGQLATPTILFQGLDDKVVPPEQSRLIAEGLRQAGVPVELHEFAGEGHGFRRAETITAVLEAELAFFARTLRL